MKLLEKLIHEKHTGHKGGIYHKLQVSFAYNSNHIEGSRLTEEQTRYIFETKTLGIETSQEIIRVNDVIETVNHFRCFDYILETVSEPSTEEYIKNLHRLLKNGVFDDYAVIGEYKQERNFVGNIKTALPQEVSAKMQCLLEEFDKPELKLYDVAKFHAEFEKIHPFYDGNGRTGRLLIFKQCLENDIVPPFISSDELHKSFYYMALDEWQRYGKDERLINVFLSAQDEMKCILDCFSVDYDRTPLKYRDILAQVNQ